MSLFGGLVDLGQKAATGVKDFASGGDPSAGGTGSGGLGQP